MFEHPLTRILTGEDLHAVFQPVLDFRSERYLAYEGLIRGPASTPLHLPAALFAVAADAGRRKELERIARAVVLRSFGHLDTKALLFVNVSAGCLAEIAAEDGEFSHLLRELAIPASRVVIEITENQAVEDFSVLESTLRTLRNAGHQIAIDDLGEGFSNLRMWAEVRPEFVKVDRHFIRGIGADRLKLQLVRSMNELADSAGAVLIAEGIETETEFATVRDLRIACGQGYLIEPPNASPSSIPVPSVRRMLEVRQVIVHPWQGLTGEAQSRIGNLLQYVSPVCPDCDNDTVYQRFSDDPGLMLLPVVSDGVPLGVITRHNLIDRFARPYRRELFGRRACELMMERALVFDADEAIQSVAQKVSDAGPEVIAHGFLIVEGGRYAGIGETRDLMKKITELQIRAARYANPLTLLPGNVPINEHIDRLLEAELPFVAGYCDINHFKPYNDKYGYRRGDQVIQALGKVLVKWAHPKRDFVGHVGGDDFVVLLQSEDWEGRLDGVLGDFAAEAACFTDECDLANGGYHSEDRRGRSVFHPVPSLSIGVLPVDGTGYRSHHEVSARLSDAKKQAKRQPGNAMFVERRSGVASAPTASKTVAAPAEVRMAFLQPA